MKTPPEIDITACATAADPAAAFNEARRRSRVLYSARPGNECYVLTRYADVSNANKDAETWSSRIGNIPLPANEFRGGMYNDPPLHGQFRRIFANAHRRGAIANMEPVIGGIVGGLVDAVRDEGHCDLHHDIAGMVPADVVGRLIGVDPAHRRQFLAWSDALLLGMNSNDGTETEQTWTDVLNFFDDLISTRERILDEAGNVDAEQAVGTVLPDDLASHLVVASRVVRRMPRIEMQRMLQHQMVGGSETTVGLITNVLWRLLQDPELMARVRADPSLDEALIEESLRFDTPVIGLYVMNDREVEFDDIVIPKSSRVLLLYMSANRDPDVFENPDRFDIDRDIAETRRKTLTFGTGAHTCQGAPLARVEGRIAMRTILDALPNLRLTGPTRKNPVDLMWGRSEMPIAWDLD